MIKPISHKHTVFRSMRCGRNTKPLYEGIPANVGVKRSVGVKKQHPQKLK